MPEAQSTHHAPLRAQYASLLNIAERRSIEVPKAPSYEDAEKLNDTALGRWVLMLRGVLRTPTD